jgi:hypothetical protein
MVYFMTLSVAQTIGPIASSDRIINELIRKVFGRKRLWLNLRHYMHFPGGTEENHDKSQLE